MNYGNLESIINYFIETLFKLDLAIYSMFVELGLYEDVKPLIDKIYLDMISGTTRRY